MLSSLPKTFQPALPYNPYQTLYFRRKFIWIQVYLNTSFCLVSHNTLQSVYQIKFQPIFTAPYPSLALASIPIPSSNLVPPPLFHFFQSYQYHIRHSSPHKLFSFHIWCSNAVTTFETNPYPQQHHLQVHSATSLRQGNIYISVRFLNTFFLMFFKTVSHIAKHRHSQRWFSFVVKRPNWYIQLLQVCLSIIHQRILF